MKWLFFQEKGYQFIRYVLSIINRWLIHDYETIVIIGQSLIIPSLYKDYSHNSTNLNIKKTIFNLTFDSPITFAAFESHLPSIEFWLNLGCGGGCLKTIMDHESVGNNRPRIQQIYINNQEHLINALGLPGKGIDKFIKTISNSFLLNVNAPIGISVGGHSLNEYKTVIKKLCSSEIEKKLKQPYFEINISCPNTTTGKSLHDNINNIEDVIKTVRSLSNIVIVIKVSPDATNQNLCDIGSLVTQYNCVTINAGNTQFKECSDVGLTSTSISIGGGGLSGPTLYKRTLEMAKLLSQFKLPLIATGGIRNTKQIIELKQHGVKVVGMATHLVKNPFSIIKMNRELH